MKSLSIKNYIAISITALVFAMLVVMMIFVNVLANMAISYDIRKNLAREVRKNNKNVDLVEGKIVANNQFELKEEGMYFLIIKENEGVCIGSYPKDFQMEASLKNRELNLLKQNGKE